MAVLLLLQLLALFASCSLLMAVMAVMAVTLPPLPPAAAVLLSGDGVSTVGGMSAPAVLLAAAPRLLPLSALVLAAAAAAVPVDETVSKDAEEVPAAVAAGGSVKPGCCAGMAVPCRRLGEHTAPRAGAAWCGLCCSMPGRSGWC